MKEPVLIIMAAGMGSRYGGLKQIDPIDEEGSLIIDFSIYDAIRAGFKKVVFIIKEEIEKAFKERIGDRISRQIEVQYVYQRLDHLPQGFDVPEQRVKPWGTGHAVLSCFRVIDSPFAVINADDYYGVGAFQTIYNFLINTQDDDKYRYAMVGYILENTLSENGHVARGVCKITEQGSLSEITERTRIEKHDAGAQFTEDDGKSWITIPEGSIVSMNMWGFSSSILKELNNRFQLFLENEVPKNPLKAEYLLPTVVGQLIDEERVSVDVLRSKDKWYGVTYQEDKEVVVRAIADLKAEGLYPEKLWKEI
jgi:NDP-sugar pyrophosphorylase family protein